MLYHAPLLDVIACLLRSLYVVALFNTAPSTIGILLLPRLVIGSFVQIPNSAADILQSLVAVANASLVLQGTCLAYMRCSAVSVTSVAKQMHHRANVLLARIVPITVATTLLTILLLVSLLGVAICARTLHKTLVRNVLLAPSRAPTHVLVELILHMMATASLVRRLFLHHSRNWYPLLLFPLVRYLQVMVRVTSATTFLSAHDPPNRIIRLAPRQIV